MEHVNEIGFKYLFDKEENLCSILNRTIAVLTGFKDLSDLHWLL